MRPWQAHIRLLMYGIQFEPRPNDHVDRVLKSVVDRDKQSSPADYLASIDHALKSSEKLADLLPHDHAEPVVRSFLDEVAKALRARS